MKRTPTGMIGLAALCAVPLVALTTAATSHEGVKNAAVKARMDLMQEVRAAISVVGGMAQGKVEFDPDKAATAAAALADASGRVPGAFMANETDPKSEAAPAIWQNWDDFVAKAEAMETAARALDTGSLDSLRAGMGAVGGTCGACHKAYRVEK